MASKGRSLILFLGISLAIPLAFILWHSPKTAKGKPGEIQVVRVNGALLEMVYVPAGEFSMGSETGWVDERPPHRVVISKGFWLGRTEVTQGLWKAITGGNPAAFAKGDDHPVEGVSWHDCKDFIARLNAAGESNFRFRLPSEAEWEYACRAGEAGDRPAALDAVAWYDRNSAGSTHPVALKQPNALGLYDMLGNVWEWCADGYDERYYARSPLEDPAGPVAGKHRVDRGGAWAYGPDIVRFGRRDGSGPDYRTELIGLRLAADRQNPGML